MKRSRIIIALILSLCLVAEYSFLPNTVSFAKSKVTLNHSTYTLKKGKTVKLKVADASASKVTWNSSNKKVATVKKGKVKALKKGSAKITAKVNGSKVVCKIYVGTPVKKAVVEDNKVSLETGSTSQISASVSPSGATVKGLTYSSSDSTVATVSKTGLIKAIAAGNAVITVQPKDEAGKAAKVAVTVTDPKPALDNVKWSDETSALSKININESATLSYETAPSDVEVSEEWSSSDTSVLTVDQSGKVTGIAVGTAVVTLAVTDKAGTSKSLTKSIEVAEATSGGGGGGGGGGGSSPSIEPKGYTRGEWVGILSDKFGFNTSDDVDKEAFYFGDTADDEHGIEAEIAQAYGILPESDNDGYEDPSQDIPLFESEKYVTREYAVYTSVKALGFIEDETKGVNCSDASDLTYPTIDAIGVEQGLLSLESGRFNPNGLLTYDDGKQLINTMDEILESAKINTDETLENIIYKEDVISEDQIETEDYTITDADNQDLSKVTIAANDTTKSLEDGDIFVLPSNNENLSDVALEVVGTPSVDDGYVTIECTKPELGEVVSEVQFEGGGTPAMEQFEPAEGVTAEYTESETLSAQGIGIDVGGTYNPRGKLSLTFDKPLGNKGKIKGKVEFTIPEVTCRLDADIGVFSGVNFKELTLSMTEKIKFKGSAEMTAAQYKEYLTHANGDKEAVSTNFELGRLPVPLGSSGLSIDIVLIGTYSVKGELSIGYTMQMTNGLQVINNSPRMINDFTNSFNEIKLKGSAKAGVGIKLTLDAFELMDLIGMETTVGPAAEIEFDVHTLETSANLYCGDGWVYMYWDVKFSEDTAAGKFLKDVCHVSMEWTIFDKNNSPLKRGIHIENFNLVEKCTYASGSIVGQVKDQDGIPVKNAAIKIYNGNILKSSTSTNANGKYTVSNLPEANYTIKAYATGYAAFETTEHVDRNETKYVEALIMLLRKEQSGEGTVYGEILNAVTGNNVNNVSYNLRSNWNNTTGNVVKSGTANGNYTISADPGNYTIQFKANGMIDTFINVAIRSGYNNHVNVALSPEQSLPDDGLIRIVLTWGEVPEDLDSHLTGATLSGDSRYHVYFADDQYYDESGALVADLDVDDTTSFGPETITVHKMTNGTMRYYVYDYTNGSSGGGDTSALSMSGACVRVYKGKSLVRTFSVPTSVSGTCWHVFDIDQNGNITAVNTMSNTYYESLS